MPAVTMTGLLEGGRLGVDEFASLFGTPTAALPEAARRTIAEADFSFRVLDGVARDRVLLDVFRRIDSGQLSLAGPDGRPRWESGWGENLAAFVQSGGDVAGLVPRYIRPGQPLRLAQHYVDVVDPQFELNWYRVFRAWLVQTHLTGFDHIFEFGCGSGHNLPVLARANAGARVVGLDWADASCEIAERLRAATGLRIEGRRFDFFHPDAALEIPDNSAVLTVGALEQTGTDHVAFIDFLVRKRPRLCVHVEPIVEWYDADDLVDYAAIRFMQVRRYLAGLPATLARLEAEGKIEILTERRAHFGSLFIEGYSQLMWRPR